ncbi:MAG: polysaccharide deacetylase family protein, partial [Casimicrobiaceae bacterium]
MMWRAAFALASPGGKRAKLSILIFHRVLPERDPLFPGEPFGAEFDQLVGHIASR